MDIHEYQAKELLAGFGVAIPRGGVAYSPEQAVYRAIYAEVNAKLQLAAQGLGEITFLNEEEAQLSSDMNDGQMPRSWALWIKRLGEVDLDH